MVGIKLFNISCVTTLIKKFTNFPQDFKMTLKLEIRKSEIENNH